MKNEYEKMMQEEWYNANYDEHLIKKRQLAQDFCFDYNQTRPSNIEKREHLLKEIFQNTYEGLEIVAPLWVDYGVNTTFGKNCFVNRNVYFMDGAPITIGDCVFIGPNCGFYTANHGENIKRRNAGLEKASPIKIGSNVWIGADVTILPGVTIGSGSVVGAGSVVTKNIPENSVAVGNPCQVLRKIDQSK